VATLSHPKSARSIGVKWYQALSLAKDLLYANVPQCYLMCTLSVVLKLLHLCC